MGGEGEGGGGIEVMLTYRCPLPGHAFFLFLLVSPSCCASPLTPIGIQYKDVTYCNTPFRITHELPVAVIITTTFALNKTTYTLPLQDFLLLTLPRFHLFLLPFTLNSST